VPLPWTHFTRAIGTTAEAFITDNAVLLGESELGQAELDPVESMGNGFRADSELSRPDAMCWRTVSVTTETGLEPNVASIAERGPHLARAVS